MKIHTAPIKLDTPQAKRTVKRLALTTFRVWRSLSAQSQRLPGALSQAASDIHAAWQESAQPKA